MPLSATLDRAKRQVGVLLRRLAGRPPAPPEFDGLLAELFAVWPAEEADWQGRPGAEAAAA